jgi:hypothetical protein
VAITVTFGSEKKLAKNCKVSKPHPIDEMIKQTPSSYVYATAAYEVPIPKRAPADVNPHNFVAQLSKVSPMPCGPSSAVFKLLAVI